MDDLTLRYRGYEGSVAVSLDDRVLHGRVLFVNDLVSYEGATVPELEASFREAVDAYLELCTDKGTEPDRPFKGAFNVRVSPTLHRGIALRAAREGRSLNEVVKAALELTHQKVVPDAQAAPGKLRRRAGAAKGSQKKPERARRGRGRA